MNVILELLTSVNKDACVANQVFKSFSVMIVSCVDSLLIITFFNSDNVVWSLPEP